MGLQVRQAKLKAHKLGCSLTFDPLRTANKERTEPVHTRICPEDCGLPMSGPMRTCSSQSCLCRKSGHP